MKQVLWLCNLTNEEGQINFIHLSVLTSIGAFLFSPSLVACVFVCVSLSLLGLELWKLPPLKKGISAEEFENLKRQSERLNKSVTELNLKLGIRPYASMA